MPPGPTKPFARATNSISYFAARGAVQSCSGAEDAIDNVRGPTPYASCVNGIVSVVMIHGVLRTSASSAAPLKAPATRPPAINAIYGTETTKRRLGVPVVRLRSIRLRIELFLILSAVMFRDLLPRLIDVVEGRFWFRFTRQY
jgi:hypothetical protein